MPLNDLLASSPLALTLVCGLFGLLIGSFLNVVAHRLPKMMEREFREACALEYGLDPARDAERAERPLPEGRYDLMVPRSACPSCQRPIRALENIPVLSWLALRGRCAGCKTRISPRYAVVEFVTGALSAWLALQLGYGLPLLGALLLTWTLIPLTLIDLDHKLLPDSLTLPLLWLGLVFNLGGTYVPLGDAVVGAMAGYLVLFAVYWAFKLATGKEGMGYGDFKLLAALGAWAGWQQLPVIIVLSSVVGAVLGIALMATGVLGRGRAMPFGPFLAIAGWLAFFYGDALSAAWLRMLAP